MARGFMGKMLWVDLTKKEIKEEALSEDLARHFLGGYGLGARILYSRQKSGVEPLGADNILGFLTGPLCGTDAIGGTRYTVVGKSPLTGGWGDANSGGDFGPYLKFSGYDAVFFTGISDKPVYLYLDDCQNEIRDASHLWGKDCYDTEDILKTELGNEVRIACIGPSGEKCSLISAVMNDKGRAAGRSGLGAVMGSKKLKAVVARKRMPIKVADEELVRDMRKKGIPRLTNTIGWLAKYGTSWVASTSAQNGDSPVKNWSGVASTDYPDNTAVEADFVLAQKTKKYACYRCPIGCGCHMKEGSGEYKYSAGCHRPEYETLAMFGPNCLNNNLGAIIKATDICNRYGLDTISAGSVIAFVMECYEKGLVTRADTDGLDMTWGNHKAMIAMLEKLTRREGFGDVIADGVKIAAARIGKDSAKYAMHVQGQEVAAHDPKFNPTWGMAYEFDPTPGRHTQNSKAFFPSKLTSEMLTGGLESDKPLANAGVEFRIINAFQHVVNSIGLCAFVYSCYPDTNVMIDFLRAVTGWDIAEKEIIQTGERIVNIRQAFNIREGLNTAEFILPDRVLGNPPFKSGPLTGKVYDHQKLYADCLGEAEWDLTTSKPSRKKLLELGLDDVAMDLWG
jgi:aldehyde:ferredoxin oxidoreductase